MNWLHMGSVTLAAFLASLVEFVEALTIVLAVGSTRGWRSAFWGLLLGVAVLGLIIAIGGPSIQLIPIRWMQLVVGALVAVFGLRWLKKATLRSAGRVPMHDEDAAYAKQVRALEGGAKKEAIDKIAFVTVFKAVLLEGFEVAFIVITAGSTSGQFGPAILGAGAALAVVVLLGALLHRPLARVPENALKKTVGVLLTAFGVYWVGEGLGLEWPFGDAFILILAAGFALSSLLLAKLLRARASSG